MCEGRAEEIEWGGAKAPTSCMALKYCIPGMEVLAPRGVGYEKLLRVGVFPEVATFL